MMEKSKELLLINSIIHMCEFIAKDNKSNEFVIPVLMRLDHPCYEEIINTFHKHGFDNIKLLVDFDRDLFDADLNINDSMHVRDAIAKLYNNVRVTELETASKVFIYTIYYRSF